MKKLQVFVSSTYSDLTEERQACVETILRAGHIPAGMELFAAGNESQLDTIKRWIDGSDVYMLILGGRYGSLEPKTKSSYTEVEYKYAVDTKKPFFAIVMDDKFLKDKIKTHGQDVIELDNQDKYKKFKRLVLSKTSRFYKDLGDLKLAIFESLSDIQSRETLKGWVRSDEVVDVKSLLKHIDALTQENSSLKIEIEEIKRNKLKDPITKGKKYFEFEGQMYPANNWSDILKKVLGLLSEKRIIQHSDILFTLNGNKKPMFTLDEKKLSRPFKIPLSEIYVELHHSPDSLQRLTKRVIKAVGLPQETLKILGEMK